MVYALQVANWVCSLAALHDDFDDQWTNGHHATLRYGFALPPAVERVAKPIVGSSVPMTEIRVQGTVRGLWRAWRVLCIHHDDDITIIAAVAGDKNNRPDWYERAIAEAHNVYAQWRQQQERNDA